MMELGPVSTNNPILAENLEKARPEIFKILRELAGLNDKAQKTYATALAQNLVYELRNDPDSTEPEELEALAGYIVQLRFNHVVGRNPTLVLRNPEYFSRILLQAIFDDVGFIIDTSDSDETKGLRELLLDIDEGKNKEQDIEKLKSLFNTTFEQPRIIATLLPFYHDYLQQTDNDNEAKKRAFIGQIAFPFIESALAKEIMDEEDPSELIKFGKIFESLRKNNGLYDSLLANLDKALPHYKSPTFSVKTLSLLEKQYKVCQSYLSLEKETQQLIDGWNDYANTFELHSPCRKLFTDLVTDLSEEFEFLSDKLTADYGSADFVSGFVSSTRKTMADLTVPHHQLRESLEPFRERAQQLAKAFKHLAQDFPPKSARYKEYQDLSVGVLEILCKLETSLKNAEETAKNIASIEKANRKLTEYIKDELNFVIAGLTPLQRIADQLGKVNDLEQRKKLEISLIRLRTEGADPNAMTQQYRRRAATTVLGDLTSNLAKLKNPLLPRSRSAGDIAALHGASAETLEKLSPRALPESPKPSKWSWTRVSPKNILKTAGYYFAIHRRLAELLHNTVQFVSLRLSKSQPALLAAPPNAGSLQQLLESSQPPLSPSELEKQVTAPLPARGNFESGTRHILPAPASLRRSTEEKDYRRSLQVH